MALSRRTKALILLAGVLFSVLAPVALAGAEDFLSGFYSTSGEVHVQATNGPEVFFDKGYNLRSGNPFTDSSFNLSTQNNGHINISASTTGSTVKVDEINGTYTNVSSLDVSATDVTIIPEDKQEVSIGGQMTALKFKSMTVEDGNVDFIYSASGTATLRITGLPANTQFGAVEPSTREAIDVAETDGSGTLTFTGLATDTNQEIEIEELGTLQVRNETNESQLITGKTVETTFYAFDGVPIAERTTTTGEIDMTGLPVDEAFIVVVNVTDYHQRTIYIDDLGQQEDIFMLNQSQPSAVTVFEITDNTGNFPLDTSVIKVQRGLNRSEFTTDQEDIRWVTVTGERLGTDGTHVTNLEKFARYRIIVENTDGDQSVLGEFAPESDRTRSFQVGQRVFNFTEGESGVRYGAEYTDISGTKYVRFSLNDTESKTSNVNVVIHERGNASNEIYNATSTGPFGDLGISVALSADQEDSEWVVDWEADNTDVDDKIGSEFIVGQSQRPLDIGDQNVETIVSVLALLLTFFMTSAGLNRYAGAVITPMMGAFLWYLGFMPLEIGVGAVIFALFLGGAYFASSSRAGGF